MDHSTPDLFGTPTLPGMRLGEGILSPTDQEMLIALIDAVPLAPFRFQGWTGKRLTASYGWHYDFDDASLARVLPIPDPLLALRARAAAFAGLEPDLLVQCLLMRYDPGAGIGWHRDRPLFEHVIGVSLGAPATMRLRRRTAGGFERAKAERLSAERSHAWSVGSIEPSRRCAMATQPAEPIPTPIDVPVPEPRDPPAPSPIDPPVPQEMPVAPAA